MKDVNEEQLKNQHLYNDKELWENADLNWYDYGFRNYDPQIGRFPQLDPLTFSYPYYTPYQYAGCEPIANVDVDGLEPFTSVAAASQLGQSLNNLGLSVGKLAVSKTLETVVMTSSKIATAGSSLSKVVSIASLGRNVLQQNSEENGIQRNLQATENSHKLPRHNDWNDWWHPKGSAAQERKNGLSFTMEGAQGEPPHIKEEYRNLNNQQGINLDGFSTVMGVATKAPFSLRPKADDFKDPWTWGNWAGEGSVQVMKAQEAKSAQPIVPMKYDPETMMYPIANSKQGGYSSDSGQTKTLWRKLQQKNPNIVEPKPKTLKQINSQQ